MITSPGEPPVKTRQLLGIAELLCWVAGIALVALYAGFRIDGEIERRQAIADFAAMAAPLQATAAAAAVGHRPQAPVPLTYAVPDKTYWSKGRVEAYKATTSGRLSETGLPVAILKIRSIGLEVPVYSRVTERNLNRGAALIAGTAKPDTDGNTAIAAHRDGYFRALQKISLGDVLDVRTQQENRRYKVVWLKIVKPTDISVLRRTAVPSVTLVTCYPFHFVGSAPSRFIVRAVALHQRAHP